MHVCVRMHVCTCVFNKLFSLNRFLTGMRLIKNIIKQRLPFSLKAGLENNIKKDLNLFIEVKSISRNEVKFTSKSERSKKRDFGLKKTP